VAARKTCTLAQLALAWVLAQGDDIVPIFGAKKAPLCRRERQGGWTSILVRVISRI